MDYTKIIKEIGRGRDGARDLAFDEARALYVDLLEGRVPDLESGAIAIALRVKGESDAELSAFLAAIDSHLPGLPVPLGAARAVVVPSYNGARKGANLTPLVALLLRELEVPVLLHGLLSDYGRVTSAEILAAFGVDPARSPIEAGEQVERCGLSFISTADLLPGLAIQLELRARLGVRNCAHSLVKMLDPFAGRGVVLASATHPAYIESMRNILLQRPGRAVLFRASEGEPYVNPKRCPRIDYIHAGHCETLFEAEGDSLRELPDLPADISVAETVRWTRGVLNGDFVLPPPLANQLATCLLAADRVSDLDAAKAVLSSRVRTK